MKIKLHASLVIGLIITMSLLTGCLRSRAGNPGAQPAAAATDSAVPTQAALLPTVAPAAVQQADPTQPQPTSASPAADSVEVSKAADDLSNMLDDLTKDLNSSDNLNDVK